MVYAVIKAGGHQYQVKTGDLLSVDKIDGKKGDQVTFDQVLLVGGKGTKVGSPLLSGASVEAKIFEQKRDPKLTIFKYKRRKGFKRTKGHAQPVTVVEIGKINA